MKNWKKRAHLRVAALAVLATLLAAPVAFAAVAKIAGLVVERDGSPIAGVLVTVSSEDGSVSETAQTNKRGKFTMSLKEAAKTYSVRLEKSGYDTYEGPIEVHEGKTVNAEFPLLSAEEGEAHRAKLEAIEAKNKASRLYNAGVDLYNDGDAEGAFQKFTEAVQENPEMGAARFGMGRIHLEAERFDQAIESLVLYEEQDPGQKAVLLMLHDAYDAAGVAARDAAALQSASAEEKAAAEAKSIEMVEKADTTLESLIASHPGPEAAARVFNQGVAAVTANDLRRAGERFSLVLEIAPEIHPARINLAHIHRAFGEWEAALSQVDIFLTHEPEHVRALALRYEVLDQLGRESEAAEALVELQRVSPQGAAEIFHEQGVRFFNANDREAALQSFRNALEIEPDHAHSHYMMGLCVVGTGDVRQAVTLLERFLELAPDDPDASAARAMLDSLR